MINLPKNLGTFDELERRAAKAHSVNELWRSHLSDIYEYFLPQRDLYTEHSEGQRKNEKIYDSTAPLAIKEAASKIQSAIAPIQTIWAELEPGEEVLARLEQTEAVDEQELRDDLQRVTRLAFDQIHRSNFDMQFYEFALDLLVGTGTLKIDEQPGDNVVVMFDAVPQNTIALEEGHDGTVKSHYRKIECRYRDLEQKWPGFKPSHKVQQSINDQPDEKIMVNEAVLHDHKNGEYYGLVWCDGEKQLSWLHEFGAVAPWVTGRYTKVSGETRGRGPAFDVYSDVRSLNKAKEFTLKKAAIDLAGIYTVTSDGITNPHTIRIAPGISIPVGSNQTNNPSIARLDTSTQLNLALFEIEELKGTIKKAFFNDMRDPTGPVRSATEIAIEARDLAQKIGSAFGRIQNEVLSKVLESVIEILKKKGMVELPKIDGRDIKIKFTSPLSRAQNIEELTNAQAAIEFTLAMGGQEMVHLGFNTEKFAEFSAKKLGVDQDIVRGEAGRKQVSETTQQMMQQQAGAQNAQQ